MHKCNSQAVLLLEKNKGRSAARDLDRLTVGTAAGVQTSSAEHPLLRHFSKSDEDTISDGLSVRKYSAHLHVQLNCVFKDHSLSIYRHILDEY